MSGAQVAIGWILATLGMLLFPDIGAAQNCADIMSHGLYDYRSTTVNDSQFGSFVNWFRSQRFQNYSQARNTGFDLGFKGVSAGYSNNESGFQEFRTDLEQYAKGDQRKKASLRQSIETINRGVLDLMRTCLETSGLHVWLETTQDPIIFRVVAQYRSPGEPPKAMIVDDPIVTGAKCDPMTIHKGVEIGGAERRMVCYRSSKDAAVTVTVNANVEIVSSNLDLPAVPPISTGGVPISHGPVTLQNTSGFLRYHVDSSVTSGCRSLADYTVNPRVITFIVRNAPQGAVGKLKRFGRVENLPDASIEIDGPGIDLNNIILVDRSGLALAVDDKIVEFARWPSPDPQKCQDHELHILGLRVRLMSR